MDELFAYRVNILILVVGGLSLLVVGVHIVANIATSILERVLDHLLEKYKAYEISKFRAQFGDEAADNLEKRLRRREHDFR